MGAAFAPWPQNWIRFPTQIPSPSPDPKTYFGPTQNIFWVDPNWIFWIRNRSKNRVQKMGTWSKNLVQKSPTEINEKAQHRKLAHCGAPIQNSHGPTFWSNFWTNFWVQVSESVWSPFMDSKVGPIPDPKFPEIAKKNLARPDKTIQPNPKKTAPPRVNPEAEPSSERTHFWKHINSHSCG